MASAKEKYREKIQKTKAEELLGSGAGRGSAEAEKVIETAAVLGLRVAAVLVDDEPPGPAADASIREAMTELSSALEAWHTVLYADKPN